MPSALLGTLRRWWSAHVEVLVVAVVAVLGQQEVWTPRWALAHVVGPRWVNSTAYLVCALALYWRRRAPLAVLAFVSAVGTAQFLAVGASQGLGVYLPWLVGLYSLGRYAPPRALAVGAPLIVAVYAVHEMRDPQFEFSGSAVTFWWIAAAAWPLGLTFRRREQQHAALREHAELLQRERELRDEAAAAHERARIAREMHDAVGHALSIIVLQTVAAHGHLDTGNGAAGDRLAAIEATARQALEELRRTVGLLQPDNTAAPQPPPGLDGLDDLVGTVRAAGVPVDLVVEGDTPLPPGLAATA
jgi:signal transduction histidine kinase